MNKRRTTEDELLQKGLSHGTVELLRSIWYPVVGNFDHLYPEWEVRDFNSICAANATAVYSNRASKTSAGAVGVNGDIDSRGRSHRRMQMQMPIT